MRRLRALILAAVCGLALSSCASTLPNSQISHSVLEGLIVAPFPVYWLGGKYDGLSITEASHDPSGAYSVQYGNCVVGGEGGCVPPLRIVTSPDNSFLPGGTASARRAGVRGVKAIVSREGKTIVLATAGVVVDLYARTAALAASAARTMVPINEPGVPQASLPAALPDTGYGDTPLPSQTPPPLRPVG